MAAIAMVGSTGLAGSNILSTLLSAPSVSTVAAFSRKQLTNVNDSSNKLRPITDSNSSQWPADFSTMQPKPSIFISALGTTRAQAGGLAKQREIDYDLNLSLAKAAREAGVRVYVLISSAGASKASMWAYPRMKGELEEAVSDLGFEKCVLVKPGLIVGPRKDLRLVEYTIRMVATVMGKISTSWLKDPWAQDADVIGKAAVAAGLQCLDGKADAKGKVWTLAQRDIVRLGRTEWKDAE